MNWMKVVLTALGGDLVEEAAAGEVDRAEDAAPPVATWGHHVLPGAVRDPGGADPGQQVDVGLVLGQHHRARRQVGDGLADGGDDLVGVGGALGDQPGPSPGRDLADAPVQGP
jgi:hypothetical protein